MFPDPDSAQARGSRALGHARLRAPGPRRPRRSRPCLKAGPETIPSNHQRLPSLAYAAELTVAFGAVPDGGAAVRRPAAVRRTRRSSPARRSRSRARSRTHLGLLAAVLGRAADGGAPPGTGGRDARPARRACLVAAQPGTELARVWLEEPARHGARPRCPRWPRWQARRAQLGLAQLARDAEAAGFAAGRAARHRGDLRPDGAMWTLAYGGVTVRMRDAKGLSDLAVLLAAPGREVTAADLIAAGGRRPGRASRPAAGRRRGVRRDRAAADPGPAGQPR